MIKKIKSYFPHVFVGTLLLAGCDTFSSKTSLLGKRESVITLDSDTKPDTALQGQVPAYSASQTLTQWCQPGGSLTNALPVLTLGDTPKKVWQTSCGQGSDETHKLISSPIYSQGSIFVMDANSTVFALNATDGKIIWSTSTLPEGVDASSLGGGVSCEDNVVFVTTSLGEIFALDGKTGKQKWKKTLSSPSRMAPFVYERRLFVTTVANEAYALNAKNGDIIWSHQGMSELTGILGTATPAASASLVVIPYSSGEVFALRSENGFPAWSDTLSSLLSVDSISSIPHVRARPVIKDNAVYLISHGGKLVKVDLLSGIRSWQKEFSGINTPAVVENSLFLITVPGELVALNSGTGDVYWAVKLPKPTDNKYVVWTGPLAVKDRLLVCGNNGEILCISPKNGKVSHTLRENDSFVQPPILVNERLYVLGESGTLYAYQ